MPTATLNSTSEVASLNRLSACTRTCTRPGSAGRRPSAVTATGSVLDSTAPRRTPSRAADPRRRDGRETHGRGGGEDQAEGRIVNGLPI